LMLMAPVTVPLIQNIGIEIQRAKNKHQFRSKVYFFMALFNAAISVPLGMKWGGFGCAMGTGISMICCNGFVMNWYYHRHIGINMKHFWKSILAIVPSFIPPVLLGVAAVNVFSFTGYSGVLLFALPYCVVYGVSVYLLAMNEGEKNMVRSIWRRLVKR